MPILYISLTIATTVGTECVCERVCVCHQFIISCDQSQHSPETRVLSIVKHCLIITIFSLLIPQKKYISPQFSSQIKYNYVTLYCLLTECGRPVLDCLDWRGSEKC